MVEYLCEILLHCAYIIIKFKLKTPKKIQLLYIHQKKYAIVMHVVQARKLL